MESNYKKIEKKWQKYWEEHETFKAVTGSSKKPYYCLVEFPYPSGADIMSCFQWDGMPLVRQQNNML